MSARATPADVDEICGSLPETWFGTSWGDVPTWLVPHRTASSKTGGRGFVLYRKPHRTATDPGTGEPYDDLLVIRTAADDDTRALAEVITDAWRACAPKSLVKKHSSGGA